MQCRFPALSWLSLGLFLDEVQPPPAASGEVDWMGDRWGRALGVSCTPRWCVFLRANINETWTCIKSRRYYTENITEVSLYHVLSHKSTLHKILMNTRSLGSKMEKCPSVVNIAKFLILLYKCLKVNLLVQKLPMQYIGFLFHFTHCLCRQIRNHINKFHLLPYHKSVDVCSRMCRCISNMNLCSSTSCMQHVHVREGVRISF